MDNNENRVSHYFKLPTLKLTALKEKTKAADKIYESRTSHHMISPKYLFGIEVEGERVAAQGGQLLHYWTTTNDGSLRNNGIEFVSTPIRAEQIPYAILNLQEYLRNIEFTERTSVHVHMNVRDLSIHDIFSLLTLYALFERVLFKWVGHDRETNVFCTPLTETNYHKNYKNLYKNVGDIRHYWNKYTALNLVPMSEKGTIEFRHLYGTLNKDVICTWVNLLSCLKNYIKNTNINNLVKEISELNNNSAYLLFAEKVFGNYINKFEGYNFQELMEDTVTLLKLGFYGQEIQAANPFGDLVGDRIRRVAGMM